jgi:histidinol-phosphate aminotransferase
VSLPIRDELRGLSPYGAPQLDVPVKLNTNENPFSPPQALIDEIAREVAAAASSLNRYPDRDATKLREALGAYLSKEAGVSVSADRVWAANGSNEVMIQILQAFGGPGRTALTFAPTYSMYEEYARDTNTAFAVADRNEDFGLSVDAVRSAIKAHAPSVVFIANPNNPTGTMTDLKSIIDSVVAENPQTIFVIDEAYAEFRRAGVPSAVSSLEGHPNLVVTRTMSKAFAFAGVRVGCLAASRELIDALMLVRLPYHLSTVTQTVALAALRYASELQKDLDVLRAERDSLVTWLRDHGFTAAESDANFVLFGHFPDRHAVWQALVDRGVLIREVGPAGWLRVTIGTPAEMQSFKQALLESLGKVPS